MLAERYHSIPQQPTRIDKIPSKSFSQVTLIEQCPVVLSPKRGLKRKHYRWLYRRASFEDGILCSEWTGRPITRMSVHHIDSILWLRMKFDPYGFDGPDLYNDPYNLIVLDYDEHQELHPEAAWLNYLRSTDIVKFTKEIHKLHIKVMNGQKNWIDTWDNDFKEIARTRTVQLVMSGMPWSLHDVQYETYKDRRLF